MCRKLVVTNQIFLGTRAICYEAYSLPKGEVVELTEKQIKDALKGITTDEIYGLALSDAGELVLDTDNFYAVNMMKKIHTNTLIPMVEDDCLANLFYIVIGTHKVKYKMNTASQLISTEIISNDTIDPCEQYKTWEEIPVSTLWFNSNTSQICFVAIDKSIAVNRINEISLPTNTKAYEYRENIQLKDNEVLLQVELDTTNMFDTTNLAELKNGNTNNAPLIRTVQPVTHLGYTNYIIVYLIKNNRVVKNIQKVQ